MGFELTRLLNQYGVKAPTMGYAGTTAVNPGTLKEGATAEETKAFNDLVTKYNTDQPKFTADQALYNQYKTDYQNRVQNTPMYAQAQFQTQPQAQPTDVTSMYKMYLGRDPEAGGKAYWEGQFGTGQLTPEQQKTMIAAGQPEINSRHLGNQNLYNATGSYWGNQLDMPTYGQVSDTTGFVPLVAAPVPATVATQANPLGPRRGQGNSGNGGNNINNNGFQGDPNSYTGGLLRSVLGTQDPSPVESINQDGSRSYGGGSFGGSSVGGNDAHNGDSSHGTRGWAMGGLVQKYAGGGEVQDFGGVGTDPSVVSSPMSIGGGQTLSPALREAILADAQANGVVNPTTSFTGAPKGASYGFQETPQPAPQRESLPQMAAAYATPEMDMYAQEYQSARKQAAADRANFEKLLQASLERKDEGGPSKAEMYFNLAAAFGAPTKTGSFGESLAGASSVMAGHKKGEREAALSARDRKDKLALEVAKYHADGSKEDVANLRALAAKEMEARRLAQEPRSEIGKQAVDAGYRPGTPEYDNFVKKALDQIQENKTAGLTVQQNNVKLSAERLAEQQKQNAMLTPAEMKLKEETSGLVSAGESVLKDLDKAFVLSANAYDNSVPGIVAKTAAGLSGSEGAKIKATREMNNLLTSQALTSLRATFGGNPTEGERAILLEIQGIGAKSKPEREAIMMNAYKAAKIALARNKAKLEDINSRKYREVTPPVVVETQ